MKYRVRLVLEFEDRPSPAEGGDGSARFVELDPSTDPALAGAGATSAVLEEDGAFRLFGHLSEALERGLQLEAGSLAGLAGRTSVDGSRFGIPVLDVCPRCGGEHDRIDRREPCPPVDPDRRCQSPLEAYCQREGLFLVAVAEAEQRVGSTDAVLLVCSPCGERLWAEGVAGEPFDCESRVAGPECYGFASRVVEAPGYGAAGLLNACRPCAELLDPDVIVQRALLEAGMPATGPR